MARQRLRLVVFAQHGGAGLLGAGTVAGKVRGERLLERLGEPVAVTRRNQPRVLGADHLGDAVDVGGDDQFPERGGFKQHARKRFLEARADEDVGQVVEVEDIAGLGQEDRQAV